MSPCTYWILSSIGRIPIGNIGDTFFGLTLDKPAIDYRITFLAGKKEFSLDYRILREWMGDVPLNEISVCTWIKDAIEEGKSNLFGGVLDEIIS